MKLLIITQKVDINDDILGFMHGWIAEFAKSCEKITVVALEVGEYDLPQNVHVLSLGKEQDNFQFSIFNFQSIFNSKIFKKLIYIFNFYRFIWRERGNYDAVFVHMNPEYVVLGGLLWKFWGKDFYFWYNHKKANFLGKIAFLLSKNIFYTSNFAYTAKFKKSKIMPVGINVEKFKIDNSIKRQGKSILSLGRVDRVKRVDLLIEALKKVEEDFSLNIYGKGQDKYVEKLKEEALSLGDKVVFHGSIPNFETPKIYNQNEIFVNLTESGSFDKTILEAMACGCLPLVCNNSLREILDDRFIFNNINDLSGKIKFLLNLSDEEKNKSINKFKKYVEEKHSLKRLAHELTKTLF